MIAARSLGVLADSFLRRSGAALISQEADRFWTARVGQLVTDTLCRRINQWGRVGRSLRYILWGVG